MLRLLAITVTMVLIAAGALAAEDPRIAIPPVPTSTSTMAGKPPTTPPDQPVDWSKYTWTSWRCAELCHRDPLHDTGSCVFYPPNGEFQCGESSTGYCVNATSLAPKLQVKCISNWLVDPDGSFRLGYRGGGGSWGRAEPIQVFDRLTVKNVTNFSYIDYNIAVGQPPVRPLTVKDYALVKWPLESLEISNVVLTLSWNALPVTLKQLVLKNDRIVLTKAANQVDLRGMTRLARLSMENGALKEFPQEIFQLPALTELYLKGNNFSRPVFTTEQKAFLHKLKTFSADFSIE